MIKPGARDLRMYVFISIKSFKIKLMGLVLTTSQFYNLIKLIKTHFITHIIFIVKNVFRVNRKLLFCDYFIGYLAMLISNTLKFKDKIYGFFFFIIQ